jgi:hypothetical protein
MGWKSHLSLLPFACQWALGYRTLYVWRTTCTWVGPLSAHDHWCLGWYARGPWVLHLEGWISGFDPLGRVGVDMRCAKKDGEWLGSSTGPHTKEWRWERSPGCAARLWSLLEWRTFAECKRTWHVTPCSGKELRTLQEMCPQGASNLWRLTSIVSEWKQPLEEMFMKTCIATWLFGPRL